MAEKKSFKDEARVELGTVEGDVSIRNCRRVVPQQGDEIVITGTLDIRDETVIEGSVRVH